MKRRRFRGNFLSNQFHGAPMELVGHRLRVGDSCLFVVGREVRVRGSPERRPGVGVSSCCTARQRAAAGSVASHLDNWWPG